MPDESYTAKLSNNNKAESENKMSKNIFFTWSTEKVNDLNFIARVTKHTTHTEPQSNGRYVTSEIVWGVGAYPTRARAKANAINAKRHFTSQA